MIRSEERAAGRVRRPVHRGQHAEDLTDRRRADSEPIIHAQIDRNDVERGPVRSIDRRINVFSDGPNFVQDSLMPFGRKAFSESPHGMMPKK